MIRKKNRNLTTAIIYILIAIALIWALFPIYWVIIASFKMKMQIFSLTPIFIFKPTLENYMTAFDRYYFHRWMLNSFIIAGGSTVIALFAGSLAAYAFARIQFKWREGIANFILSLRMFPPIVIAIPLFMLWKFWGISDTYHGMMLAYIVFNLPLAIWVMRGFFEEVPKDFEEAAQIDGCTKIQAFLRIIVPITTPAIVATFIICFIFAWNEFIFALFLSGGGTYTGTLGMTNFVTTKKIDWGALMAAGTMFMIPPIALALYAQKYLVRGLTFGVIKG